MTLGAKKIGIIGAMDIEIESLVKNLKPTVEKQSICSTESGGLQFYEGSLSGVTVVVVKSGIGKVNAALCAQRLIIEFGVTHVINTGIAGAMAHGLNILDFVVSTDALYHDFDATGFGDKVTEIPQMKCSDFPADPFMINAAEKAFPLVKCTEGHKIIAGRIASGDQFISSHSVKETIRKNCNPACVEMEGTGIAQAAYINSIPFVIIRCMSDKADDGEEATFSFNNKTAANMSAGLVMKMITLF